MFGIRGAGPRWCRCRCKEDRRFWGQYPASLWGPLIWPWGGRGRCWRKSAGRRPSTPSLGRCRSCGSIRPSPALSEEGRRGSPSAFGRRSCPVWSCGWWRRKGRYPLSREGQLCQRMPGPGPASFSAQIRRRLQTCRAGILLVKGRGIAFRCRLGRSPHIVRCLPLPVCASGPLGRLCIGPRSRRFLHRSGISRFLPPAGLIGKGPGWQSS